MERLTFRGTRDLCSGLTGLTWAHSGQVLSRGGVSGSVSDAGQGHRDRKDRSPYEPRSREGPQHSLLWGSGSSSARFRSFHDPARCRPWPCTLQCGGPREPRPAGLCWRAVCTDGSACHVLRHHLNRRHGLVVSPNRCRPWLTPQGASSVVRTAVLREVGFLCPGRPEPPVPCWGRFCTVS